MELNDSIKNYMRALKTIVDCKSTDELMCIISSATLTLQEMVTDKSKAADSSENYVSNARLIIHGDATDDGVRFYVTVTDNVNRFVAGGQDTKTYYYEMDLKGL